MIAKITRWHTFDRKHTHIHILREEFRCSVYKKRDKVLINGKYTEAKP